jgi:hypothetical protein
MLTDSLSLLFLFMVCFWMVDLCRSCQIMNLFGWSSRRMSQLKMDLELDSGRISLGMICAHESLTSFRAFCEMEGPLNYNSMIQLWIRGLFLMAPNFKLSSDQASLKFPFISFPTMGPFLASRWTVPEFMDHHLRIWSIGIRNSPSRVSVADFHLHNCRHVSPRMCISSIYSLSTSVYSPISNSLLIVSTSCLLLVFRPFALLLRWIWRLMGETIAPLTQPSWWTHNEHFHPSQLLLHSLSTG